jgi:hypothetical protein
MIPLILRIVIIFVVLTIAYVALAAWSRFKHRLKLSDEWETQIKLKKTVDPKDEFIARGMKAYDRSLKPKLILGVYVIPGAIATLLIYLAQYG